MIENLNRLVEISEIDKKIDNFIPLEKKTKEKLNHKLSERDDILSKSKIVKDEITNAIQNIRYFNNQIEILGEEVKERKIKFSNAIKEKEINSLTIENDIGKEKLTIANFEISRFEKIKSRKETESESLDLQIKEIYSNINEINKEVSKTLYNIDRDKKDFLSQRDMCILNLNPKILAFYERIRIWAKNTAVIKVKNQACYGCYMKINDKVYADLIKKEELVTCTQCGRILYLE